MLCLWIQDSYYGNVNWIIFPKFKKRIKIRMDLKWPEMPLKVNFGHPIWPIDQKWPEMRSKDRKKTIKFCIDLKWPELRSKVNLGNPKSQAFVTRRKTPYCRHSRRYGCPRKCLEFSKCNLVGKSDVYIKRNTYVETELHAVSHYII